MFFLFVLCSRWFFMVCLASFFFVLPCSSLFGCFVGVLSVCSRFFIVPFCFLLFFFFLHCSFCLDPSCCFSPSSSRVLLFLFVVPLVLPSCFELGKTVTWNLEIERILGGGLF